MGLTEITLAAALRDASSPRTNTRNIAVRNLAPALLAELGLPSPSWRAAPGHEQGEAVVAALRGAAADDENPLIRGLAAIGLAQLGEAQVLDIAGPWLENDERSDGAEFMRECAVIATSFIGAVAPDDRDNAPLRARVLSQLRAALGSPLDDVRFQASVALAEVGGADVESELIAALIDERQPKVRENLVDAIARIDPPGPAACKVLTEIVASEEGAQPIGFAAALVLAAARRPEGGPRLVAELTDRERRNDALEALAALGPAAPQSAHGPVRKLARSWLTPAITRVRAAYALARLVPDEGMPILDRLARHPRRAIREAVEDAHKGLAQLEDRSDDSPA